MSKEIPRMKKEDLRQFVLDLCNEKIWTDRDCKRPEDISMSFIILSFMEPKDFPKEDIGLIWEYISKANTMAVNGMPTFFSCHLMHKDDWKIARQAAIKEMERRRTMPILEDGQMELPEEK
jgi:hypothetical protein